MCPQQRHQKPYGHPRRISEVAIFAETHASEPWKMLGCLRDETARQPNLGLKTIISNTHVTCFFPRVSMRNHTFFQGEKLTSFSIRERLIFQAEDVVDGIMDPLERQEVLASLGFRCALDGSRLQFFVGKFFGWAFFLPAEKKGNTPLQEILPSHLPLRESRKIINSRVPLKRGWCASSLLSGFLTSSPKCYMFTIWKG